MKEAKYKIHFLSFFKKSERAHKLSKPINPRLYINIVAILLANSTDDCF